MAADNPDLSSHRLCHLHLRDDAPPQLDAFSDSDSDSEDGEPVVLGFVHKPTNPWCLARQLFPSKTGGTPAWLDPINLPRGKDACCDVCGNPLQFLLQLYAPIEGKEEAFHRTLFVFVCPSMACLQEHQKHLLTEEPKCSVKVFRSQLYQKNDFYSMDAPKHNGSDLPSANGAILCSWCGTWRGEKNCGGCRQAWYCSRAHQVDHWKAGHSSFCRKVQARSTSNITENAGSKTVDFQALQPTVSSGIVTGVSKNLWPEFEILDEEEACGQIHTDGYDTTLLSGKEEEQLTREFQGIESSKEQSQWANFQARLSRAPDQVLRYCRSSSPKILWPRLDGQIDTANVPACNFCKGPRIFEFQILPQLLYFLGVSNQSDSLDWATIAIFSCKSSCSSSKSYLEELVWVQLAQ